MVDAEARSTKRARLSSTSTPDTEQSTPTPSASTPDTERSTPTPSTSWFLFHANVNGTVHRLLMHEGATLHDVVCLAFEHFLAGAWGDEMRSHLWSVTVYTSGSHSQYTGYDSALNEELRDRIEAQIAQNESDANSADRRNKLLGKTTNRLNRGALLALSM